MNDPTPDGVPKAHPASREILPDDPMQLTGIQVPGDPGLMLRLLVEEYARMGWGLEPLMQLARDPNYQAFHGLLELFGEDELLRRIKDTLSRCGVMRVTVDEAEPPPEPEQPPESEQPPEPEQLVQIEPLR